jgi:aminoglycoside N3'-acetyltransferase
MRRTITRSEVTEQLLALGVKSGDVLLAHTAFSKVSPVEGGPRGLIEALLAALGPHGTLAMPNMSDDDDHPFDPRKTDCRGMGIVADTFWKLPGVLRSDSWGFGMTRIQPFTSRRTWRACATAGQST